MFVRYNGTGPVVQKEDYYLGDLNRQFLHIQYFPNGTSRGVYIYAHGNGGDADIKFFHRRSVIEAGYAFISWESITTLVTPEENEACQSDHKLVMEWVVANAEKYNLDVSNIIMGGRSRGSIVSWPIAQGNASSYKVKGIYMYGAFPLEELFNESIPNNFPSYVTPESPPIFLAYGPECPKPIEQDCLPSPNEDDIHTPKNGQLIIDAYEDVGLLPWATLKDGMENANITNIMHYFPSFVSTLPNATRCKAGVESLCPEYNVGTPKECGQCARSQKRELIYDALCDVGTVTSLCLSASGIGAESAQLSTEKSMSAFIFGEADQVTQAPTTSDAAAGAVFKSSAIFFAAVSTLFMLIPAL